MTDSRPLLLLAETGLQIRNLLLGPFTEAVLRERRMVAAVPPLAMDELRARLPGAVALVPYITQPLPTTWWRSVDTYMYRFRESEKPTASMALQTRLFEPFASAKRRRAARVLRTVGRAASRAHAMGAIERAYLERVSRRPTATAWQQLLAEHRPAAVVSTMLTHSLMNRCGNDLVAVTAAHRAGIPVGALVQSWDNLSSKTAVLPSWVDRYWAWSEYMRAELLALSPRVHPESVEVVGSPHFDAHADQSLIEPRSSYCARHGLEVDRPIVLIGTGTAKLLPGEPDAVRGIVERLAQAVPNVQLMLRLHPKDNAARWEAALGWLADRHVSVERTAPPIHMDEGGFVEPAVFYREQLSALRHAAVVINTASTLTVDAALLDTPVVCIGFDLVVDPRFPEGRSLTYSRSTHFGALVETGGVPVARTVDELVATVIRYLDDPSVDRSGRQAIVALITATTDGSAGERLATAALDLARGSVAVSR